MRCIEEINQTLLFCSDEAGTELKLEFGYDVPISSQPRAVLVMENKSAIPTQFSLAVEHFCAGRVPTPPDKRDSGNVVCQLILLFIGRCYCNAKTLVIISCFLCLSSIYVKIMPPADIY